MDQGLDVSLYRPQPSDLVAFLPFACRHLEAPFQLRVVAENAEYAGKSASDDRGRRSKRDDAPQAPVSADGEPSAAEPEPGATDDVMLRVRCDSLGRPVELLFHGGAPVPRLLLKIVGLCVPHHERLARVAVRRGALDGPALHDLARLLPLSHVTEVSLDDTRVTHRNAHLLLEPPARLRVLSLARCDLADEECAALAARLVPPLPASRTLACLSLQSNRIRDEGARALGAALRANRALRHLDLAGNAITSGGAAHVFRSLMPFPVSGEEIGSKRRRTFELLRLREEAYARCYRELTEATDATPGRTPRSRRATVAAPSTAESLASRAAALAAELVRARPEPFDAAELLVRDGATYCLGNFTLSYLNLAYNDLDRTSVRMLAEVLAHQAGAGRPGGLLRVVLEGNALPAGCPAAREAEELLGRALDAAAAARGVPLQGKPGRKSLRPKLP